MFASWLNDLSNRLRVLRAEQLRLVQALLIEERHRFDRKSLLATNGEYVYIYIHIMYNNDNHDHKNMNNDNNYV